jgi:hypothetical protein
MPSGFSVFVDRLKMKDISMGEDVHGLASENSSRTSAALEPTAPKLLRKVILVWSPCEGIPLLPG